jgi:hypothetical protein
MTLLAIFAIFGLAFLIKDSSGPFDIIYKIRFYLLHNKYVGVFFFKLLDCYFCVGCHCGWIVYLLTEKNYTWQFFTLWTLAGGAISLILNAALARLHRE